MGKPDYPGRGFIFGLTTRGNPAGIYFLQGRSDPSRMRRLELYGDTGRVYVNVNSETTVEQMIEKGGNPDLLLYNAIKVSPSGLIVVSNGFQTDCDPKWEGEGREEENLKGVYPNGGILHKILDWDYSDGDAVFSSLSEAGSEVDPLRTARIACVGDFDNYPDRATIGIVIRPRMVSEDYKILSFDEEDEIMVNPVNFVDKGKFRMAATYGVESPPFEAAMPPRIADIWDYTKDVRLDGTTPEQLVREVWEKLSDEITVGVAAAMRDINEPYGFRFAKINKHD
jgi:IMP cyclohydrolase